jgi:hypothetical protein
MSKRKPPSHDAVLASLRRLWRRVLVLQAAVVVLFALVAWQAWQLHNSPEASVGGLKPPLPESERPPPEEQFVQTMQEFSARSAEVFGKAQVPYSVPDIEAVARLEPAWLTGFAEAQELDADTRSELGQVLGKYMMHTNDIYLQEYRGSHSPKDTSRFVKIERSRLHRTLIELLGSDGAAALQPLVEEQLGS